MELTEQPLISEDMAALQPVGDRLKRLVASTTTNFVHDATHKPVPDSRIGKAVARDLSDAYDQARQRLVSAEDHLRTILNLLAPEMVLPSFSLFTLVRGAAVPIVHARHLLDPAIDENTRLGRGLSARLENLEQEFKVLSETVPPTKPPKSFPTWQHWFDDRIEHLRKRARGNGIVVRRRKKTIIHEPWPYDTDLFETYMPGKGKTFFKYLSGFAHSLPWTHLTMHTALPSDDPRTSLVPTDVNVKTLAAVLNNTLSLYDETVGFYLGHGGYPLMVWRAAKKG